MGEQSAAMSETVVRIIITCGACLGGLLAATPQAFNAISKDVMLDTHTSDVFISLLTGFGLAGLQFTILAGISLDMLGAWKTCLIGDVFIVLGYISMSYTTTSWLLVPELALVGLGSGAAFLSGFKTVIELGHPLGVGLTSCAMSVSIFLTVGMKQALLSGEDCTAYSCWRHVVRLDGVVCGVVFIIAAAALSLRNRVPGLAALDDELEDEMVRDEEPEHRTDEDAADVSRTRSASGGESVKLRLKRRRRSSGYSLGSATKGTIARKRGGCARSCAGCYGGLFVFRDPFFWRLAIADVAGLGCGIFILASARQLWTSFDAASDEGPSILKVFSVLAAVGNVGYPVIADFLARRNVITRVRLMAITLAVYGGVLLAIGLIDQQVGHTHTGSRPSSTARGVMFALMASMGFGFGAALVGFPVCVSQTFPVEFFGTILSYVQLLASTFAVVAATLTAATFTHFGSYSPMYWGMTSLMLLGAVLMALPRGSKSGTGDEAKAPLLDRASGKV